MERISRVQNFLKERGLDYLFLEDPVQIFYLSGLTVSSGWLAISKDKACLFVDYRYLERAKSHCPFGALLLKEEKVKAFFKGKGKLGFDSKTLCFHKYAELKKLLSLKFVPVFSPLKEIMALKDRAEIALIKKACRLTFLGYRHLRSHLKEGVKEEEIALMFEGFGFQHKAKLAFQPIIAFGPNSSVPHHASGLKRFKEKDLVLMDLGLKVGGYCADMTRTFFLKAPDKDIALLNDVVMEAYMAALKIARSGVAVKELDIAAHEVFAKYKMGKYALHRLGHGVGLQIHEYPSIHLAGMDKEAILKEGMVFTIEPGLYMPGRAGIRYENTILIKKNGPEELTRFEEE